MVNDKCSTLQSVAIKYFEKGHTFMSADSYHHLIEKAMKEMKNIYDGDFVAALSKNGVGLIMDSSDFMNIPKGHSKSKFTGGCPKLSDIKVCKGSSQKFVLNRSKLLTNHSINFKTVPSISKPFHRYQNRSILSMPILHGHYKSFPYVFKPF